MKIVNQIVSKRIEIKNSNLNKKCKGKNIIWIKKNIYKSKKI